MATYKCASCGHEFSADTPKEKCLACNMRSQFGPKPAPAVTPAVTPAPKVAVKQAPAVTPAKPLSTAEKKERQRWAFAQYTEKHKNDTYHCTTCGHDSKGFYCAFCRKERSRKWRAERRAKQKANRA